MSYVHCNSHAIVGQVYKSVVNDTITAVRSFFLDEGVDEQVLQELKTLWETKLKQSRAVDLKEAEAPTQATKAVRAAAARNVTGQRTAAPAGATPVGSTAVAAAGASAATGIATVQPQTLMPIQITIPPQMPGGENKTIVVQVPVSAMQSGVAGQHLQTILSSAAAQATFALPQDVASNMFQQQLNEALRQSAQRVVVTAPSAGDGGARERRATFGAWRPPPPLHPWPPRAPLSLTPSLPPPPLPPPAPRFHVSLPSNYMAAVARSHNSPRVVQYASGVAQAAAAAPRLPGQLDGSRDSPPPDGAAAGPAGGASGGARRSSAEERRRADRRLARRLGLRLPQTDGMGDTSDSDDDDVDDVDDDIDDDDDDIGNDEDEEDQEGQEEEPLNSEDDVSDHEPADLQETFNVMVCQYDKITRSRNKWKFHLKDGIMNLDGKDYIFQKAGGDAEW